MLQDNKEYFVVLKLTDRCYNKCSYCFVSDTLDKDRVITIEQFIKNFEFSRKYFQGKQLSFILMGGDVLTLPVKQFKDIVKMIRDNGYNCGLSTSGSFLQSNLIDILLVIKNQNVGVKIHVVNEDSFNFAIALKVMDIPFELEYIYDYTNLRIAKKTLRRMLHTGCKNITLEQAKDDTFQYKHSPKANKLIKWWNKARKRFDVYDKRYEQIPYDKICDVKYCQRGLRLLMIDINGDIYPCYTYYSYQRKLGNVKDGIDPIQAAAIRCHKDDVKRANVINIINKNNVCQGYRDFEEYVIHAEL